MPRIEMHLHELRVPFSPPNEETLISHKTSLNFKNYFSTCMTESLHCSPETTTTLSIGYTPNQKFKVGKKLF